MDRNKQGLSPRQIINRYKKGVYTDTCADEISATISTSDMDFDSVAIPIQKHWLEEVFENIGLCFQLSKERDKADEILADIDDEHARNLLLDISTPKLWNAIMGDGDYWDVAWDLGFRKKYQLPHAPKVINAVSYIERKRLENLGIDMVILTLTLQYMFDESKLEK